MPPYLAGRSKEKREFQKLLKQEIILENLVLTGLRGVGKTVLLETFKPMAIADGWAWAGTDLTEASSLSEDNIAIRLFADLSVVTSGVKIPVAQQALPGFNRETESKEVALDFHGLMALYANFPGLASDKIKHVLEYVWSCIKPFNGLKGIIFAYDEAQNLSDHAQENQFPLSLLLDVFQSLQRKDIPFMLAFTGLPTLFPKLVEARTYAERMFHVVILEKLKKAASRDAILKPIKDTDAVVLNTESVDTIVQISGGYPYFIQFICREVYDLFILKLNRGESASVPVDAIIGKLDTDFFYGRWVRATDRQKELMQIISQLPNSSQEFTVQEIVGKSKEVSPKSFSSSHVNQMLSKLCDNGLIYKNRHGKYSFAVPMLDDYIRRQPAK